MSKKMRVVDAENKGNVVRYYLADETVNLQEVTGDDWDDAPYDLNCGRAYDEYISAVCDVAYPFDSLVIVPSGSNYYCRNDFKDRHLPFVLIISKEDRDQRWGSSWDEWCGFHGGTRVYFGDKMEPTGAYNPER